MFKKDDLIMILPEFQDPGDADFVWVVVGDEEKGRVDVQHLGTGMSMPPRYTFVVSQICIAEQSADSLPPKQHM